MGRTFRRQDKKRRQKLRDWRRERRNKRSVNAGEYGTGKTDDKKKRDLVNAY